MYYNGVSVAGLFSYTALSKQLNHTMTGMYSRIQHYICITLYNTMFVYFSSNYVLRCSIVTHIFLNYLYVDVLYTAI